MTHNSMPSHRPLKARAEAFCAKLNDGLAAVALVLAIIVFVSGTYRTIELLELNVENGLALPDAAGGQTTAPQ